MKSRWLAVCVIAAACNKSAPEKKDPIEVVLSRPKYVGPGMAVVPKPLPPATLAPGPAYLWVDSVGLVTIDKGKATMQTFPELTKVVGMVVDSEGLPIVISLDDQAFRLRGDKASGGSLDRSE